MENEKKIEEQFASLPLGEKMASLFKMELATISEAFNYVVKESSNVVEKLTGLVSEFGKKVETEFKEAQTKGKASSADNKKSRQKGSPGSENASETEAPTEQ